jgi:hypothetical protein
MERLAEGFGVAGEAKWDRKLAPGLGLSGWKALPWK